MKQTAIAALFLMLACSANAEDPSYKWSLGGSISYSDYERDDKLVNDSGAGIKIHEQYRINRWIGLEGAFYDSPEFKDDFTPDTPGDESETTYQGVTAHGVIYLPSPAEKIDFFLKGGYFYFFNVELKIDGIKTDDTTEDGLSLGFGTAIEANENIGLRVEFDWYDVSSADLWTIGIGAEYRF